MRTRSPLRHDGARAAVVGRWLSGFYAADQLAKAGFGVDVVEAPTPFGLVRAGVTPDHPKIRSVTPVHETTASHPGFQMFGVRFGRDVSRHDPGERYAESVERWLRTRAPAPVTWADWRALDDHETSLGARHGRPRVKLVKRAAMLAAAATSAVATR